MIENSKPKGYVDTGYLDAVGNQLIKVKQRSYTRMQIQPSHKVLDLGCGPGTDTIALAAFVGVNGQVIGADYDEAMIFEADKRAAQAGVSTWVKHKRVDAMSLPFDDDYFDSCRSERLFQHLLDPAQALSEMIRVTKSGGWVVALDTDWGSLSTDCDETDVERRLARFMAESFLSNGYSGRKLYRLFKQQNLADVSFEPFPFCTKNQALGRRFTQAERNEQEAIKAGAVTIEELRRWRSDSDRYDADGTYFSSVNTILMAGRKS